MRIVNVGHLDDQVELDVCMKCETVFFDVDEVESLPVKKEAELYLSIPAELLDEVRHMGKGGVTEFKFSIRDFGVGWSKRQFFRFSWRILPALLLMTTVERQNLVRKTPWLSWIIMAAMTAGGTFLVALLPVVAATVAGAAAVLPRLP